VSAWYAESAALLTAAKMPKSEGTPALVQELFAFSAHYTGADSSRVPADDDTRLKQWYWFCKEKVFLTCTLALIPE